MLTSYPDTVTAPDSDWSKPNSPSTTTMVDTQTLAPPLGGRPIYRSLKSTRPHLPTIMSTPRPKTPLRRSHSSPPSVTPEKKPWLALLPPQDVDVYDYVDILELYLSNDLAPYLEEERGLTSIFENIRENPRFHAPASRSAIEALAPSIFAPAACQVLKSYYAGLHGEDDDCDLQCGGLGDTTISQIFRKFLSSLVDLAASLAQGASSSGKPPSDGNGDGNGNDGGNGNGIGDGDGKGEVPGGDRAGGGAGGESGGAGGGGPNDEEDLLFSKLPLKDIPVPARTTPPRPTKPPKLSKAERRAATSLNPPATTPTAPTAVDARRGQCRTQALRLAIGIFPNPPPLIHPLLPSLLDPSNDTKPSLTLFHATRLSSLRLFRLDGINPNPYSHSNYFSAAPSFNLADSVEAAVFHVLHGTPTVRNPITHAPTDPILVFEFQINMSGSKIHNLLRSDEPLQVANADLSKWVKSNYDALGKAPTPKNVDFVIGPFLVVGFPL
ncbi:hypothetical protein B0H16DRAFT_676763 [Mycena metata]|uniref:Uncharacterized protein n=1 Tax=Mycena metata TaxID=1033252 RepID=A0AAD7J7X5_9AGAR|nr:hypothetical protein B0H16DRAFT_676763 [Mycena metata]